MKRICVYCGSSTGKNPEYIDSARALAKELVIRHIGLVYGGANVGIMGEIANTVLAGGGEVVGVIPKSLVEKEVSHNGLTELRIVDSMHERKAIMAEISDGFIALPGGLGTIEELFEVLAWSQLGFHKKPCALLNVKQYYASLCLFLDHAVEEQFIKSIHREMLLVENEPSKLLDSMESYNPPTVDKWIGRNET
ncbi:MAG: TIGR00730 family Rossman fold protein [Candidatus Brocadiaceae bacterium]|nr:TIGR00730 family Rossman fold protein [Candidatus Brocadiaceae bacterium]